MGRLLIFRPAFKVYQRAPGADGHFIIDDAALWGADIDRYVREHQ